MVEVSKSEIVRGFSPLSSPDLRNLFKIAPKRGARVELILTGCYFKNNLNNPSFKFNKLQDFDNVNLYRYGPEVKLAYSHESLLALGLYRTDDV